MDFASLRAKLDNIAEELAQLPEQETVAIEEEEIEEAHMMPKTLKCKDCGDTLGNPTTDCPCDSMDPKGDNWIMVDVDNDGDMDMAMANEEDHHEKDEDGNVIPHDEIEEEAVEERKSDKEREADMMKHDLYSLMLGGPADSGIAKLPRKDMKKEEEAVEEATVEVPVQELAELMQLAGYANYAERIEEFANSPADSQDEPAYMDAEDQLVGLSGGLNGPKNMHTPAAGGDNPMDKEALKTVEENLYKSYKDFLEEAEIKEED
jgi:hypothetical protein